MKTNLIFLILFFSIIAQAQDYPTFGPEKDVTINGLTFDAMEPFISPDGEHLFFNNLNDGIDTKLFYASKVNDSIFTFIGELNGTNQTNPQLNAVADLDELDNFYWTSTRDYPAQLDNLHYGKWDNNGNVTSIGRVRGDFNKNTPGWLVMDHGVSLDGQYLYFNNARLDGTNCEGPCETEIGVAEKINDSTFTTLSNSSTLLQTVNDHNYKFYASYISSNNLELFYTRYPDTTLVATSLFEICVVVRSSSTDNFSEPQVLFSEPIGDLIEAVTLTKDMHTMYYHKKTTNSHVIVMRERTSFLKSTNEKLQDLEISVSPNPSNGQFSINTDLDNFNIQIFDSKGVLVSFNKIRNIITLTNNPTSGTYLVDVIQNDKSVYRQKIIID